MDRRRFLLGSGAMGVLVAGGAVWRASGDDSAFEPWDNWRADAAEPPLAFVRAAILASNAANCQPWLFKIDGSSIELFVDARRNLGAFDPFTRELHISAGCALENLLLAASANGYRSSVALASRPLDKVSPRAMPVASVNFWPAPRIPSDLYDAIPRRHTNRAPFDSATAVPKSFVDEAARVTSDDDQTRLFLFDDATTCSKIAHLVADAGRVIASHREIQAGMTPWLRSDWRSLTKERDGVGIGNFGESDLETALEKIVPAPLLAAVTPRPTPAAYLDVMLTGRLFGIIAVRDRYDGAASIRAGRIWQRMHLLATARGLAARPANQSVELIDHQRAWGSEPAEAARVAEITGEAAWQPTFMFFVGYPTRAARRTPRRDVHDVLL